MFQGTGSYYARYRPGYPPELLARLAAAAGLDGTGRLLDLACGTGQLAVPLAAYAEEVVAADREPDMLAEIHGPPHLRTVLADAEGIDESWGEFRLVTIGRAFHWLDGPAVLDRLARITPQVALVGDKGEDSSAYTDVLAVSVELFGARPAMKQPTVRYAESLAASAFSDVTELSLKVERTWTVDELIGLAYSTSFASPARVGERREEFERTLRERLQPAYRERVTVEALLGRRRDE
jgi:SAM-dependent methyltransferase